MKIVHTIISKREVPVSQVCTGAFTGKHTEETLVNGGKKGVCVRLDNGGIAWGFGETIELAEANAVRAAQAI